jgi:YjbE family integral membrane protein
MMGMLEVNFLASLLSIVIIDLVLAGDNAIVIGLAARRLPKKQQKKAIVWGTVGAIIIRSLLTIAALYLLKIPGLMLLGGLLLLWIGYRLLAEDEGKHLREKGAPVGIGGALRTILVADTVMSLDNVLAVAGAAHGQFLLVVAGLIVSIPIVIWGSTIILRLVERFPIIIYIGAGVVAWTAGRMIVDERLTYAFFHAHPLLPYIVPTAAVAAVVAAGAIRNATRRKQRASV